MQSAPRGWRRSQVRPEAVVVGRVCGPLYDDDFPRLLFRNQETSPPPLLPPPKRLSRPGEDGLYDDNNNGYTHIIYTYNV